MKRYFLLLLAVWGISFQMSAQTIAPVVKFYSKSESADVEVTPGESQIAQAPVEITCTANIDNGGGKYNYVCEWKIYRSDEGEESSILTRFDDEITYTLTASGGYGIKLYATFVDAAGDSIEEESEPISIVVSESKLVCPDGFSPNGDGKNDKYVVEFESLVKVDGVIFNRWGKKLHTFTLDNLEEGWDGMQGGKYVKDGAYFLHLDAVGSEGLHYKIKKVINVLKGLNDAESSSVDG